MGDFGSRLLNLILPSLLLTLSFGSVSEARLRIRLPEPLSKMVEQVMIDTLSLQQAYFDRDTNAMDENLNRLIESVRRTRFNADGSSHSMHLQKVLGATQHYLHNARRARGDAEIEALAEAFRQLVQIARVYRLEAKYQIFFCSENRTVWVQSGRRPQNPLYPDLNCGVPVS